MIHNIHAPYLIETPHGSVLHCACCGRLQVAFGGLTLLLDRSCYEQLRREVALSVGEMRRGAGGRWFRVSTDAGEVAVPLRAREVTAFHELLRGARAMLELEDRLRLIAAGRPAPFSYDSTCS